MLNDYQKLWPRKLNIYSSVWREKSLQGQLEIWVCLLACVFTFRSLVLKKKLGLKSCQQSNSKQREFLNFYGGQHSIDVTSKNLRTRQFAKYDTNSQNEQNSSQATIFASLGKKCISSFSKSAIIILQRVTLNLKLNSASGYIRE